MCVEHPTSNIGEGGHAECNIVGVSGNVTPTAPGRDNSGTSSIIERAHNAHKRAACGPRCSGALLA